MTPLSLPDLTPTHRPIHKSHPTARNQDPTQSPAVSEVGRRIDRETHEDISYRVEHDQALGKPTVGREGRDVEFEEAEGASRLEAEFDAEAEEDGPDDAGGDPEVWGLGQFGGGHCWVVAFCTRG